MSTKRRVLRKLRRLVAKQLLADGEIKLPVKDLKYVGGIWFWCPTAFSMVRT